MPLERPPALGAAPAAVVLSGNQYPPQLQLAEGFTAHSQRFMRFGGVGPDPLASRCGWCGLTLDQPSSRTTLVTAGFKRIW